MTLEGTHSLWADLHAPGILPAEADFTVIGIPFDGLASARLGVAQGPERIRFWSRHLTPFSEDRTRLGGLRVCDLGDIPISEPRADFARVAEIVAGLPNILITLGGDHSVSIPVFKGQRRRSAGGRLGILWVDAHPDLCNEFDGSRLSHACVLRRGLEYGIAPRDVCLVGLRSWEDQEIDLIENSGLHVYTAADVAERGMKSVASEVRDVLTGCDGVHISFDIDALDPSAASGTGIPDYGGLSMRDVLTCSRPCRVCSSLVWIWSKLPRRSIRLNPRFLPRSRSSWNSSLLSKEARTNDRIHILSTCHPRGFTRNRAHAGR